MKLKHHKIFWVTLGVSLLANVIIVSFVKLGKIDADVARPYATFLGFFILALSPFTLFSLMISLGYYCLGVKKNKDKRYHDATAGSIVGYLYVEEIINK